MVNRPKIDIPRSGLEKMLEIGSTLGTIFGIYLLWRYWAVLPHTIPTHFNFAGQPDGWGGKGTLLILPIVSVFLFCTLTILQRFPQIYNYPVVITEANARQQYSLARTFLTWLFFELVWFFAYLEWKTIQAALGQIQGLGLVVVALMAVTIGTTVYYIRLSHKAK
jgi:uncharacterized membrane protein